MSTSFHSHETGQPFETCCSCDASLSEGEVYIVNQSFVGEECVFEMAMCMDCREDLNAQLSEQSRVAMFDFMHDHTDMEKRDQELGADSSAEAYLAHCITCRADAKELQSFSIGGMFAGTDLIKGPFPMLMCSHCEEKLSETISDETRDVWDRFIGEHFPGPPSEVRLPTNKPVLI